MGTYYDDVMLLKASLICNFQTQDILWGVVMATAPSTLTLSIGSSTSTINVSAGFMKVQLPLAEGSARAILVNSATGETVVDFSPPGFTFSLNPPSYNFNAFVAVSS
jgi:glucan endo-1,3-alpha-glucosidase